jgi:GTP cyclohydrolase IA
MDETAPLQIRTPLAQPSSPRHDGAEDPIAPIVERLIRELGEDPEREGLLHTPGRVADSLRFLLSGYELNVADVINGAVYAETYEEMVLVRDIEMYSLCEHHLLPFYGKAHVAYLPRGRIVGLSKIPRIVEVFARRLQVQERLTTQIANAIDEALDPYGVAVVIDASHLCMMMRGVEKQNSRTVTSALTRAFQTDPKCRNEFLDLIGRT